MKKKFLVFALLLALAVSSVAVACKKTPKPGPESGVYFFDADGRENLITLFGGNKFTYLVYDENKSGEYTLKDGQLQLDFSDSKDLVKGTLRDEIITIPYGQSELVFRIRKNVTVTFDSDGGSAVDPKTVLNGRTVSKPSEPTRGTDKFMGWYNDKDTFTSPFGFGAQAVTKDITVYAFWAQTSNQSEYEIDFKPNYPIQLQNAPAFETVNTIGGKVYNVKTPADIDGYTFAGWWTSMFDDASRLTTLWTANTVFKESSTLFGVWQSTDSTKIPAPLVKVDSKGISWDGVGVSQYKVEISGPDGFNPINETQGANVLSVDFSRTGEYTIKVTALSGSTASETTERHYKTNGLSKVSLFNVIKPSVLVFNTVENAVSYQLNIYYSDEAYGRFTVDLGANHVYNFASYRMRPGGIKFTVTASASGFVPSTSREFEYNRVLPKIDGMYMDETTQTLWWNAVSEATGYVVSVVCGDTAHSHQLVNIGNVNHYSLKECPAKDDKIVISIYPVAAGYNPPEAVSYQYFKKNLATPGKIRIEGETVKWTAVQGATGYEIIFDGETYKVNSGTANQYPLPDLSFNKDYTLLKIKAVGTASVPDSLWSDEVKISIDNMSVMYGKNTVSWNYVYGAESYQVKVNDDQPITVNAEFNAKPITFKRAETNTVYARYFDGTNYSDWYSVNVYTYAVTINHNYEGAEIQNLYVAKNDTVSLPVPVREGHVFEGWFTATDETGVLFETDFSYIYDINLSLYARWTPNSTAINYNYSGKTGDGISKDVFFGTNFQLEIPVNNLEDGTVFMGWYNENFTTQYTNETGKSVRPWAIDERELTVYARWGNVLKFTKETGGYAVTRNTENELIRSISHLTIPAKYNGEDVVGIAGLGFLDCGFLSVVSIPDTMLRVTRNAFDGCIKLSEFIVYETGKQINDKQYTAMNGLLFKIIYDDNLGIIGYEFACFPLGRTGAFEIPAEITEISPKMFYGAAGLTEVIVHPGVTEIGEYAFDGCTGLSTITFKKDESGNSALTTIGNFAFQGSGLTAITIPKSVRDTVVEEVSVPGIGLAAFANCNRLGTLSFESGTSPLTIPDAYNNALGTFYNCGITNLVIPARVVSIGTKAFAQSSSLRTLEFEDFYADETPAAALTIKAEAFHTCTLLDTVEIGARVTSIADRVFQSCTALDDLSFAEGDKPLTIGTGVFQTCTSLSSVRIPARATSVGGSAFYQCTQLTSVSFEPKTTGTLSLGSSIFYNCALLANITIPNFVTSIGGAAFSNCYNLQTVTFDDGGTGTINIGNDFFNNCTNLHTLNLSTRISGISYSTFSTCNNIKAINVNSNHSNLQSIDGVLFNKGATTLSYYPKAKISAEYTIPSNVKSIASYAFVNAKSLSAVIVSGGVTAIGSNAFYNSSVTSVRFETTDALTISSAAFQNCTALNTLTFDADGSVAIGESAFQGCTGLSALNFVKDNVITIGKSAFRDCKGLSAIAIPASVTDISESAFQGSSVTSVTFNSTTTLKIGTAAFRSCNALTSLSFAAADNVEIGESAFQGCAILAAVTIPANVTKLGAYAFKDCVGLTDVSFPEQTGGTKSNLESIGDGAFANCTRLNTVFIPEGVTEIKPSLFKGSNKITAVVVATDNADYESEDGVVYTKGINELVYYPMGKEGSYTLPSTVTVIPSEAFRNYVNLTGITLHSDITSIGSGAFRNTGISEIQIPANITVIADFLLDACEKLSLVTFLGDVTKIGEYAFRNTPLLTAITLPQSLEIIGAAAFQRSGLINISIPASITDLGANAFQYCDKLNNVQFAPEINLITLNNDVFASCTSLTGITIPASVTTINSTFRHSGLGGITIPATVTAINSDAFRGSSISNVTFTDSTVYTEGTTNKLTLTGAFQYCLNLVSIKLPARLDILGANTFLGCTKLETVEFEGNCIVASIGNSAFQNSGLKTLVMPDTVSSLGNSAFDGCPDFTSLTISKNLTSFNYAKVSGNTSITEYKVAAGNTALSAVDGVLFNDDKTQLILYPATKTGDYTVPNTVTSFASNAFWNTKGLADLDFQAGGQPLTITGGTTSTDWFGNVTLSSNGAFNNSSIQNITIPVDRTVSIGAAAFYACKNLTELVIPANVISIGLAAFNSCINLEKIEFKHTASNPVTLAAGSTAATGLFGNCEKLETITLPAGLTSIAKYSFANCKMLTTIKVAGNVEADGNNLPAGVTAIEDYAFYHCTGLQSINLPNGLESVGYYSFNNCTSLEYIFIPKSVTNFGGTGSTFYNCTSLEEVEFEEGFKAATFAPNMFQYCESLQTINIPKSLFQLININIFYGCTSLRNINVEKDNDNYKSIDGVLYSNDGGETYGNTLLYYPAGRPGEYRIPDGVTAIGDYAFDTIPGAAANLTPLANTKLTKVYIPNTVTSIGTLAFRGTAALLTVEFEKGGAQPLTIPTTISTAAFLHSGIKSIEIPSRIPSLAYAFYTSGLQTVTFESGFSLVGLDANIFNNCYDLQTITLPSTITTIGINAFYNCNSLTSINIPKGVTSINLSSFAGCSSLTEFVVDEENPAYKDIDGVLYSNDGTSLYGETLFIYPAGKQGEYEIPRGVTTIGANAFDVTNNAASITVNGKLITNSALTALTIPDTVKAINSGAFRHCAALDTVTFAEGFDPTTLGSNIFAYSTGIKTINIPASLTPAFDATAFTGCAGIIDFVVTEGNINYLSDDGVLFSLDKKTLINFPLGRTEYDIPDGTEVIGASAFRGSVIERVFIPNTVRTISGAAFADCENLQEVTFEDGTIDLTFGAVTSGIGAFYKCTSLQSITLPSRLVKLEQATFRNCSNLDTVVFNSPLEDAAVKELVFADASGTSYGIFNGCNLLANITLPHRLTRIGDYTFNNLKGLLYINIPASVESIGAQAFTSCSNLAEVYFQPDAVGAEAKPLTIGYLANGTNVGNAFSGAFSSCSALETINLPDRLTKMGVYTFGGCTALSEIVIPMAVTTIDANAFQSWTASQYIYVRATDKPAGWVSNFSANATVIWGYQG